MTRPGASSTKIWPDLVTDPFLVHVAVLRRVVGTVVNQTLVGPFDPTGELGPTALSTSRILEGADMELRIQLNSASRVITMTGTAAAPWTGLCSRCAVAVTGSLVVELNEVFVERSKDVEEAYPILDDAIDVGPAGREALIVGLPLLPLCRPLCAGLCPTCGIDRNEATCQCASPRDDRWSALDGLGSSELRGTEPG